MKVLVAGGAGYIGSHVCLALLEAGHELCVFDDLSTGSRKNIPEGVSFEEGSILFEGDVQRVMADGGFEGVVHLAALKAAGDSMSHPETYAHHNISGSINLLNAAARTGVKHLVFSSSAAVFGEPQYLPLDEKHPCNPINFYGFTKLEIERLLAWYAQLRGLSYTSLRYFNAAGYDAEQRVPALEVNPKNLIPLVMEVAIGVRSRLAIFGDDYPTQDGTCIRDYIHVTDLATAHVQALEYMAAGKGNLVCNLGTGTGASVAEVVAGARKVTRRPIETEMTARRPGDPAVLVAKSERAAARLGWEPVFSDLESILRTTWAMYRPLI